MTTKTAVTVTVTPAPAASASLRRLVRDHGTAYDYARHTDHDGYGGRSGGVAVMVDCRCPGGHGVAGLPHRAWVRAAEARIDIDLPTAPALPAQRTGSHDDTRAAARAA